MRILLVLLSVAIASAGLSCGGDAQPGSQANVIANGTPEPIVGGTFQTPQSDTAPRLRDVVRVEGDAPPPDARFTVCCAIFNASDHVIRAKQAKEDLMGKSGLRAWHILHTEQKSMLCYGYYRTYDDREKDPKETTRAQADLKAINELKDVQGDRLFRLALFQPVDEQDPESPAAWNLVNAPANAYWSLEIAAYRGSQARKQAAVDCVRQARASGIQAYYYHGETISSVCVGAWPREAIKEQDTAGAQTADPTAIPLLLNQPLPQPLASEMRDREGNRLTVMAPKLEIIDPSMAKAIKAYPEHAVNGELHVINARDGQQIPDASFLVVIPHAADTIRDPVAQRSDADSANGANRAATDIIDNPTPVRDNGLGRLRSLDK